MKILGLDHIGIAVIKIDDVDNFYKNVLKAQEIECEVFEDMRLKVKKYSLSGVIFELLQPLEGEQVISKFLQNKGEGIHHICFEVDEIDKIADYLSLPLLWQKAKKGAGGHLVNFLSPKYTHGILIEFCQHIK
jgi:methylmalonyl-CoA epimerase